MFLFMCSADLYIMGINVYSVLGRNVIFRFLLCTVASYYFNQCRREFFMFFDCIVTYNLQDTSIKRNVATAKKPEKPRVGFGTNKTSEVMWSWNILRYFFFCLALV